MSRTSVPWNETQRTMLVKLRDSGMPYRYIAARVGHTEKACMAMYCYLIHIAGRPRMKDYNRWTEEQSDRHIQIIEDHAANRQTVRWDSYAAELGHSAKMCRDRASEVRRRWRAEKQSAERALLRSDADNAVSCRSKSPAVAPPIARPAADIDIMRATSTARFRFAAEMASRIGAQGITAGLLGDPPPGRSALDKQRAGEAGTTNPRRINHNRIPPAITLAGEDA